MHDTRVDTAWLNLSRHFSDVDNGDCAISVLFLFFFARDAISRIRRSKPRFFLRAATFTNTHARRSLYRIAARCITLVRARIRAPKGIFIARYIHTTRNISARERRCIINDIFTRSAIRPRIPQETTRKEKGQQEKEK